MTLFVLECSSKAQRGFCSNHSATRLCLRPSRRQCKPLEGFTGKSLGEYNEFTTHAWPLITARAPFATLRIVGSVSPDSHAGAGRILHVGRVSDAELAREYQAAHVVINPQVAGTGLKIKCVEALSAGCPLVMNRAGADGLEEGEGRAFLVAAGWEEFADHVVGILTDDRRRLVLESEARAFAERLFSPEAKFAGLDAALTQTRQTV